LTIDNFYQKDDLASAVPSYLLADSYERMKEAVDHLSFTFSMTYDSKFEIVSFDKQPMLREDFGSSTPYFHFGLNPAIALLIQEMRALEDSSDSDQLIKFIEICFELEDYELQIVQSITDATEVEIQARLSQAEVITACYTVSVLILSFAVYRQMFDALGKKLARTLSILRLIL
jgi:hypothetical protein